MSFQGFTSQDFDVMAIAGFQPRMAAIKEHVRPKLSLIGEMLAPELSALLGEPMYAHVAKHMRRTVNPPDDTWVAFSNNPRGYKAHPHFQIGIWNTHLFVRWGVIYECRNKQGIGVLFQKKAGDAIKLAGDVIWSGDHKAPGGKTLDQEGVKLLAKRLATIKSAELLCGLDWDRHSLLVGDGDALLKEWKRLLKRLAALHQMAVGSPENVYK